MPELPEVETTVRGLERVLKGRRIERVEARRPDLRRALPHDLGQRLTGARVTGLGRRAKYGLIDTDRGDTLVFHLGMSGHWRIDPSEIAKHDHFIIATDDGRCLALNDARRFGSLDLVRTEGLAEWPPFKALGPEPLDIDARELRNRLAGRTAADQAPAARPAYRRGPRQHLCLRGAVSSGHSPEAGRREHFARPLEEACSGHPRRSRGSHCRRRIHAAGLRIAGRRAWLFPEELRGL